MAKTNKERQAAFREKMRQEGKHALHVWVTPVQAQHIGAILGGESPLQVTAILPPSIAAAASLPVTAPVHPLVLPPIPAKTPAPIMRDLQASERLLRKKQMQIEKLQKDAAAIEGRYRHTVEEWKKL